MSVAMKMACVADGSIEDVTIGSIKGYWFSIGKPALVKLSNAPMLSTCL